MIQELLKDGYPPAQQPEDGYQRGVICTRWIPTDTNGEGQCTSLEDTNRLVAVKMDTNPILLKMDTNGGGICTKMDTNSILLKMATNSHGLKMDTKRSEKPMTTLIYEDGYQTILSDRRWIPTFGLPDILQQSNHRRWIPNVFT